MLKVMYWGDSPVVNTGFGVVAQNLLKRLHEKGYQITVLGVNGYGEPYDQEEFPYQIYPCEKGGQEAVFGFAKYWWLVERVKPDILFWLNDFWLIDQMMKAKPSNIDLKNYKIVGYYPVDSGPIKPEWMKTLNSLDAQVCYTHFAEGIVTEANNGVVPKNLHQIYHGVNTDVYKPLNQSLVRNELGLPQDAFIVGMVARNQFRKRFDILAKAFAEFSRDKPEAKLYLHTAVKDIGFDISDLSVQFKLKQKLILTEGVSPATGVPQEYLNKIYNSFDINALISLGDGFGLPVAESMATGCVQLVNDHSAFKELVGEPNAGLLVKTSAWIMNTSGLNTWGGVADVDDIIEKLNILYSDKKLRVQLAQNGYDFITQSKFNWDTIAEQFNAIFKRAFHIIEVR